MNYLAIDTSGNYLTVAAVKDGRVFSSFLPDCAMKHSVTLMGEVEKVLSQAELSLAECDFFAAVVGAGSFTG
ncbi:MAG: tRNA (adenosine(37)-N6)-threonylcarbamoyltransferase complex dimerization subunit type 1 TsaB, partial [Clostridia bacterium]|nr:tRNA (adenosine(37)-N6)-threonylcarbamoyltransferase complex dimerization subunit type 1 TsaB [Clostridia bacterium]